MSNPLGNIAAIKTASARQRDAASPQDNVFVSANAGSGKTRVLVNRVSRLLLSGVKPAKILCLTYTKAAAGEMQSRLFDTLGEWSILPDDKLQTALEDLDADTRPRTAAGLTYARRLFADALETPEGLKVQTIHAFCERLLRRFPIEAGIAPGYEALDDNERKALLAGITAHIGERAYAEPAGDLAGAITYLASLYANTKLDALYGRAADKAREVLDWADIGTEPLADWLGIEPSDTPQSVKRAAWEAAPKTAIKAAAGELSRSGPTNQKMAALIFNALTEADPIKAFDIYAGMFFKTSGDKGLKASVVDSKIADDLFGSSKRSYGSESLRMEAADNKLKYVEIYSETCAVLTVSEAAAKAYMAAKRLRRKMDFNDQILLARDLLKNSAARDWVLYKLDGGVDHVLIDEAQDTGPEQWDIIDSVSAEFDAIENSGRTKFAVGDEKQSIYGFQGARPDLFLRRFQAQTLSDANARSVQMSMSFRSAPQVLDFVDTIFDDCGASKDIFDLPPGGDSVRHTAARIDAGRVELWPLTLSPEKDDSETAWEMSVDAPSAASSREQLAGKIAKYIAHIIAAGVQVFDSDMKKPRAVRAGDIMILVQKRSAFFDSVIRNLKSEGVPVAGADRLKLTSNIGVQDLISLGKFVALNSDDLSLAEVLKSPIFGLSDDDLIFLTTERGSNTLWTQLNTVTVAPHLIEARGTLRRILEFAPGLAPYEFYARTLSTLMSADTGYADSILKRLYSRLGIEAADPIDAFLGKALAHQRAGPPSLDKFLREMAGDGSDIKREPDARADEVRVMTVHGAKGLEAPVVILPDTTQLSKGGGAGFNLDPVPGGGLVVRPPAKAAPEKLKAVIEAVDTADYQEYLRKFYVALTRAETRLIICGFQTGGANAKLTDKTWYDWARRAFEALGDKANQEMIPGFDEPVQVFGPTVTGAPDAGDKDADTPLPPWAQIAASPRAPDRRYVTPSHLLAGIRSGAPALSSPIPADDMPLGLNPFARGIAIHKLLEILPDVTPERRDSVARKYLSAQSGMSDAIAERVFTEVFTVLNDPRFSDLFAPGSRAEVSLAGSASGLPENIRLNAQIDRLAVTETNVWIVDYKSNRPPPNMPDDVAQIYIAQMAAYRALARDIYPKKTVRCALLWTDTPRLMELPSALLDGFDLRAAIT